MANGWILTRTGTVFLWRLKFENVGAECRMKMSTKI